MNLKKIGVCFAAIAIAAPGSLRTASAVSMTVVANENPTQATVITRTNNRGYNVVFWNIELPTTFTGTGASNTVTDLSFLFWQNSPQSGAGVLPENIALYDGFFTPGKYSTTQGSNLFRPIGNSYSSPTSATGVTPATGLDTVQIADTSSGQLNIGTFTPGVNQPYGSFDFAIPTTQTPFNGTFPNATGQYSLVIWTESPQNYQWKGGGQLVVEIPGVSGIKTSLQPGYLDGSGGGAGVVTPAGSLAPVPIPEPSTYCMTLAALACGGFSLWRRQAKA